MSRRLIIDILYKNLDGSVVRFRRDAEIQTSAAANAEDQRRRRHRDDTGSPDGLEWQQNGNGRHFRKIELLVRDNKGRLIEYLEEWPSG